MMTLQELQVKLETYPERLQKALIHQSEADAAVQRIQEEIKNVQANAKFTPAEHEKTEDESGVVSGETYEQVKFRYDRKAAQLELQVRQTPAAFGLNATKPTEGAIGAVLLANDELAKLKGRMIELGGQQRHSYVSPRFESRVHVPVQIDEKLQKKLWKAQDAANDADARVEAIRSELDTYRMLTIILVNREVSATLSME